MGHLGEKKAYQIYKLLFARSLVGFGANDIQKVQRTDPTPFGALHLQTYT